MIEKMRASRHLWNGIEKQFLVRDEKEVDTYFDKFMQYYAEFMFQVLSPYKNTNGEKNLLAPTPFDEGTRSSTTVTL